MVAHLIFASYVAISKYQVVYSGAIGNRRTVSLAAIGAAAAKAHCVRLADYGFRVVECLLFDLPVHICQRPVALSA